MAVLDDLNKNVATIGAIVAAIVGLNGALTTCSNDTANRYTAFRAAVASEESFWKDRFTDYAADVAIKDEKERHGKMMALAALSQHPVPTFEEYWLGPFTSSGPKKAAEKRLASLRQSLMKALINDRDPEVAELVRQSAYFEQAQQAVKPQDGSKPSAATTPQRAQAARQEPSLETQVLGIGPAQGWDVDIFWCTTDSVDLDMDNYNYARTLATRLGQIASSGLKLSSSVQLGRVQLRPLPQLIQGGNDYPVRGSGNTLLVDNDPGEQEAASVLLKLFANIGATFAQAPTTSQSKFYLSGFVCGNPAPPPAQTAATSQQSPEPSAPRRVDETNSRQRPNGG